jgi:arsenate reductase
MESGQQHTTRCNSTRYADIDIAGYQPRILSTDAVRAPAVVITMGCGDACPSSGKRCADCDLGDPAGQPLGSGRSIRVAIRRRVEHLLTELGATM